MEEVWRSVKGYEGYYEVSNMGRVKSLPRKSNGVGRQYRSLSERILKPSEDKKGYLMVWLYKGKQRKTMKVHRLVAAAFIPNPLDKPQIDHINGIKDDNLSSNLRWCTGRENFHNPITYKKNAESKRGVKNHKAVGVLQYTIDGRFVKKWECMSDVKREIGIAHSHISSCCRGKRNSAGGFSWRYNGE